MTVRRLALSSAHQLYQRLYKSNRCAYCGEAATTSDHFVPISFAAEMIRLGHAPKNMWLVPACVECNLLAGDTVFESLTLKRQFIQLKLRHRYIKLVRIPSWGAGELESLGYNLQRFITSSLGESRIIRERLEWQGEIEKNIECVSNAIVNFTPREHGRSSAPHHASKNGTTTSDKSWLNSGVKRKRWPAVTTKSAMTAEELGL